jgi:hypothetical protein
MNEDQWKGRLEIAIGSALELTGLVLNSPRLKERGQRERKLGQARTRYGSAIAAVVRRSPLR